MGTGQKLGTSFQKGVNKIRQWVQGKKWELLSKKVLTNSSMGTGQKMGTSFQKGVNKFVNGYRANR